MKFDTLLKNITENHINFSDYNLEKKYEDFNSTLFNNELPKIPVVWAVLKGIGGKATGKFYKRSKGYVGYNPFYEYEVVPNSLKITISTLLKRSEQELDGVLLHEMAHIYFIHNNMVRENHGIRFVSLINKLSDKVGFKIPLVDEIKDYTPASSTIKPIGVILITKNDGTYSFTLIKSDYLKNNLEDFSYYCMHRLIFALASIKKIDIYIINSQDWHTIAITHPIQRKDSKKLKDGRTHLSIYKLTETTIKKPVSDIVNDIINKGELLNTIEK